MVVAGVVNARVIIFHHHAFHWDRGYSSNRSVGKFRSAVARNAAGFGLEEIESAKLALSQRRRPDRIVDLDRHLRNRRFSEEHRYGTAGVINPCAVYSSALNYSKTIVKCINVLVSGIKGLVQSDDGNRERSDTRFELDGVLIRSVVASQRVALLLFKVFV